MDKHTTTSALWYILLVILALVAGLLAGAFLLGGPAPTGDVNAAVSRITNYGGIVGPGCEVHGTYTGCNLGNIPKGLLVDVQVGR